MKRSEVLEAIDKVYRQFVDDWVKLDIGDEEQIANFKSLPERILDKMIEIGMLPPTTKLSHIDANDNAWEPEDK